MHGEQKVKYSKVFIVWTENDEMYKGNTEEARKSIL
jgi:hypothetical protein